MDYLTKWSIDEIRNAADSQAINNDSYNKKREETDRIESDKYVKARLNDILSRFIREGKRSLSITYGDLTIKAVNRTASLAIKHGFNAYVRIVKGVPILDIDCF